MNPQLASAIKTMAAARGITVTLGQDRVTATISGHTASIDLPADSSTVDELADLPSAFPSRAARGDIREKTLYNIVQDMVEVAEGSRISDQRLRDALPEKLRADPSSRRVLASVMAQQYWFRPKATGTSAPATFLTPFHADLPGAYDYRGRYKSFRGNLLLFLCFDGASYDLSLARNLLEFLSSDDGLNPLDHELLRAARQVAEEDGQVRVNDPGRLLRLDARIRPADAQVHERLAQGAYDQAAIDLMRRDLNTVMTLQVPRHDKVAAFVLALSLHVALYYYRVAFSLGDGLHAAARTLESRTPGPAPDFGGQVLFRVGTGGDRPVSSTDPCATAWWRLDEQHLLAMPANMVGANLLHRIAVAVLGDAAPALPQPHTCAAALTRDHSSQALGEFLAAAAGASLAGVGDENPTAYQPGDGGYALRAGALAAFRLRPTALKQRGRDVVNTLVGGFSGNLKRNRGRVRFFELDEDVLFLLVKLILDGAGEEQMSLYSEFLPALHGYGLAPQNTREEELLADALERLGLLYRYSDAGEATYVRYIR